MRTKRLRSFIWLLFAGYCAMMLWLLLLHRVGEESQPWRYNLHPGDTIGRYLWVLRHGRDELQCRYALANLAGNVGLFLPLGVLLPMLFQNLRKLWPLFMLTTVVIALLELTQTVTGLGTLDVDDWILNLSGTMLGYFLWLSFSNRNPAAKT